MKGILLLLNLFIRTLKNKIYKYMFSISKNTYIDKLDDILIEYKNTYHKAIKTKPVDVKSDSYAEYNKKSNKNIPNLKLVIMLEYQNTKTFLLKEILQIDLIKSFLLKKLKIQFNGLMSLAI